jgi:glycosyltransferase involved in cell wall biosynthesis
MSVAALTAPGAAAVPHVHTLHDYWLLCQRSTMVAADDVACATPCTGCRVISGVRNTLLRRHPPEIVLAVSEAVADEHRRRHVLADRIRVLRNPVEVTPLPSRPARRADGPVVVGYLGPLVPIKGIATLLRAFAGLPDGAARLRVAGRGPLADQVHGPGVELVGWVDEVGKRAFLDEVDVLVVPSEWRDPAPLVLNEARANGIPVIGARIGGIPELVAPECEPLLFPSGDVAALTDRLRTFVADPARFAPSPLAAAASGGWPAHVEAILGVYREAGERRGR